MKHASTLSPCCYFTVARLSKPSLIRCGQEDRICHGHREWQYDLLPLILKVQTFLLLSLLGGKYSHLLTVVYYSQVNRFLAENNQPSPAGPQKISYQSKTQTSSKLSSSFSYTHHIYFSLNCKCASIADTCPFQNHSNSMSLN